MVAIGLNYERARMVLEAFRHFGRGLGEALLPKNILSVFIQREWRPKDMEDGIAHGISLGWFEPGANSYLHLTAAGFAEL
jgi:hypothetical protein